MSKELGLNYSICALNFYLTPEESVNPDFHSSVQKKLVEWYVIFKGIFRLLWQCASCEACPAFFMLRTVLLKLWEIPHVCL